MLESSLAQMQARVPGMPVSKVLLTRVLLELGRTISAHFEQQIRPWGLNEVEFRVLSMLFAQPDGTAHPSDLCARTGQSPANMSRISDALVSRELITRVLSAQDRRRMVLRITPQGEELVRGLLPTLFAPLQAIFADLSEPELLQLIAQLRRVMAQLDAAEEARP
jgi:MarR family transcriptional repressor of emrRAB